VSESMDTHRPSASHQPNFVCVCVVCAHTHTHTKKFGSAALQSRNRQLLNAMNYRIIIIYYRIQLVNRNSVRTENVV
jgi:hypothetical protein